ncbi:hypothetical protein VD0002_g6205 [Verticillium dahliae]|uniref:Glycosyltransferase 2-like domain-containing protein n=2 Tax=Verticillium dahliae TaxID=27337 RepID=G2WYT2_VERDV|nr:uncharacterized protein VDAG_03174 [Verticillium dahliae VdLs.17]KAF3344865.1 hypothetical protein VdG2_07051 [Verticillium dahliae VDG2]KAH6703563.1 glycosyl transferase family group 2-domain-containing protein [Verticillium dahliae]EGY21734.1 hypothetical protein VDAG_03174 [Verticillium dahliae VdLs.17]PNH28211.1 hypothetical protein BJF96_g8498 [Verticillium dahliae]PNH54018.1 hypothetical protein VD0003_g3466 [Verticillium dahliae]
MSLFAWCSRRAGGLAMIALLALSYWVISRASAASHLAYAHNFRHPGPQPAKGPTSFFAKDWPTIVFAYYCLFIHFLVFAFPFRSCYAVISMTWNLKKTALNKRLRDFKFAHRRRGSSSSLSSSETLTSYYACSSITSQPGDPQVEAYSESSDYAVDHVIHAIIIPNYKEEVDTLRETLDVLASHPQAVNSYDIYLGMESREANCELKATSLIQEFLKKFRNITYTVHPSDIPNEAAGKGSNVAWAARMASQNYAFADRKDVIFTGIDADSHLSANYTALITTIHMAHPEKADTTLYAAPIIFDRNAHIVPAVVRVADILWGAGGLSGLYKGSSVAPPTSVYSLPLKLVDRVGGWDCDSEAIGEDLHMYLKCLFALNGNLTCRTVYSPVSQSNVTAGSIKGLRGVYADMQARYKQALRHMWGALDTGYAMRKFVELIRDRKHTSRAYRPLHTSLDNDSDAYVPELQPDADHSHESGVFSDITQDTLSGPNWWCLLVLSHRLFEAHFLPVQMTILVIASTLFQWVAEGNEDPHNLGWIFAVCNIIRTVGIMEVALFLFLYERHHDVCVRTREREMIEAGLAQDMNFSYRSVKRNFVDYVMVPLVAPLYGSIPCAQAQICHFWTVDLVYTVSGKITRQRSKSVTPIEQMA